MVLFCDTCLTMFTVDSREDIAVCPVCDDIYLLEEYRDEE